MTSTTPTPNPASTRNDAFLDQFQQQSIVLAEPSSPTSSKRTQRFPADIPNDIVDADTQQKFTKIWDKEKNYTGEPYDLLDDKLRIFMSICYNIQVKPDQFHALFPRILTGRAQTYYIDHVNWTSTFRKAYDSIKQHFDTEVNHVHYYTEWTTISFNKLRADNATKSLHEVLQLLLDKLQLCQRALGNAQRFNRPQGRYGHNHPWNKKCFVCNKEGCWSTKHTAEERQRSRDQYVAHCHFIGLPSQDLTAYVLDFEGHEMDAHDDANDPGTRTTMKIMTTTQNSGTQAKCSASKPSTI
ncbi:hypothetical protein HRG_012590 [Hirsutella rhossiliensis]